MILCLDVGNSQIYGGLYHNSKLIFKFRKRSNVEASSDEIGVFLRSVLRENGHDPYEIRHIGFCTVVPQIVHSLKNACNKYFNLHPFVLGPGIKTGLKIKYRNPLEVGADRIANSISAVKKFPNKNLIIVDFGTATTFCAISKNRDYLGGVIIAGLRISMEVLEQKTAKLPTVEILKPKNVLGRSTVESIQSGLHFGHFGMAKEIIQRITLECFSDSEAPLVIGTGGFATQFSDMGLFDHIETNLVLEGIFEAMKNNKTQPYNEVQYENYNAKVQTAQGYSH